MGGADGRQLDAQILGVGVVDREVPVVVGEPRFARLVALRRDRLLVCRLHRFPPLDARTGRPDPFVAVEVDAGVGFCRRYDGGGVGKHLNDPGDRRDGAGFARAVVVVVGHDLERVDGGAKTRPVLRGGTAPRTDVVGLGMHGDGEQLALGVQRGGQFFDEEREDFPILGAEALVIDVDAVVAVGAHQSKDGIDVGSTRIGRTDGGKHGLPAEAAIDDGGHDAQAEVARLVERSLTLDATDNLAIAAQFVPEEVDLPDQVGVGRQRLHFELTGIGRPDGDVGSPACGFGCGIDCGHGNVSWRGGDGGRSLACGKQQECRPEPVPHAPHH